MITVKLQGGVLIERRLFRANHRRRKHWRNSQRRKEIDRINKNKAQQAGAIEGRWEGDLKKYNQK